MTKTELEAEIASLKQKMRRQEAAIDMLSKDVGMRISLPWAPHAAKNGAACYISGSKKMFSTVIIPLIEKIIMEHGIAEQEIGRASVASEVSLGEGTYHDGKHYIVPRTVGLMLIKLMDAAAVVSLSAYAAGYTDGSNLLGKLQQSEITVDEFEESLDREKAVRIQTHRLFETEEQGSFERLNRKTP